MERFRLDLNSERFEAGLERLGFCFERISLKTRPDAIHWHIRKPGNSGTLEATLESEILHLEVRANRGSAWVETAIKDLLEMTLETR